MTKTCVLEDEWPIVWATYTGDPALADFEAHLDELIRLVRSRKTPFAFLVESHVTGFGASQRKATVDFMKRNEDLNRYMVGVGAVLDSSFQRGIITAVLWIYTPPYEFKVFATRPEAEAWATGLLAAR